MKLLILIFMLAIAILPVSAWAADMLSLPDLLAEADAKNPEVAASRLKYQAARERIPQAGAFADPMLAIGLQNLPLSDIGFSREGMTSKMLMLSQMLPYPGKRAEKARAATAESAALEAESRAKAQMVRAEVKSAYYGLLALKKEAGTLERGLTLVDAIRQVAEARYSVGTGMYRDITKAQLEASMLVDKKLELAKRERTQRAYLASLLGRDRPVDGEVGEITPAALRLDRDRLITMATNNRPAVKAAEARMEKGRAMQASANLEKYPDFTLTAQYMQRDRSESGMGRPDMVTMTVGINLPVWDKARLAPMAREAAIETSMAERERDMEVNEAAYRIDSLIGEAEQADRTIKLYKDIIIPQAEDDISAGLAAYETGRGDIMPILDSRRMLLEYETGYYNMLAEREKALAELEAVVGREPDETP